MVDTEDTAAPESIESNNSLLMPAFVTPSENTNANVGPASEGTVIELEQKTPDEIFDANVGKYNAMFERFGVNTVSDLLTEYVDLYFGGDEMSNPEFAMGKEEFHAFMVAAKQYFEGQKDLNLEDLEMQEYIDGDLLRLNKYLKDFEDDSIRQEARVAELLPRLAVNLRTEEELNREVELLEESIEKLEASDDIAKQERGQILRVKFETEVKEALRDSIDMSIIHQAKFDRYIADTKSAISNIITTNEKKPEMRAVVAALKIIENENIPQSIYNYINIIVSLLNGEVTGINENIMNNYIELLDEEVNRQDLSDTQKSKLDIVIQQLDMAVKNKEEASKKGILAA